MHIEIEADDVASAWWIVVKLTLVVWKLKLYSNNSANKMHAFSINACISNNIIENIINKFMRIFFLEILLSSEKCSVIFYFHFVDSI